MSTLISCAPANENLSASSISSLSEDADQPKIIIGESSYFNPEEIVKIMNIAINLWDSDERLTGVTITKIEYDEEWYKWMVEDELYDQMTKDMTAEAIEALDPITEGDVELYIQSMIQKELSYLSFQVSFIATDDADKSLSRDFEYIGYHMIMKKIDGQWTISSIGL